MRLLYLWVVRMAIFSGKRLKRWLPDKIRRIFELKEQNLFCFKSPWTSRQKVLWCHCASGEFEYAKPVLRELKQSNPDIFILVTFFSPSVLKSLDEFSFIDAHGPLPWDLPEAISQWLAFFNPEALIVARTDAWPEMLYQARNIPRLLFSATCAPPSHQRSWALKVKKKTLNQFSTIYCVSDTDRENLKKIGVNIPMEVRGDTRYDQAFFRLEQHRKVKDFFSQAPFQIFIAGSTWPEDEKILLQSLLDLREKELSIGFVFVPHEPTPHHLSHLTRQLSALNIPFKLYSQIIHWKVDEVLIVDQTGLLADLYPHAHFAFVGGSFRKTVHSVMEPLVAGLPTVVGPYHENNREACEFKERALNSQLMAVTVVHSSLELTRWFHLVLQNSAIRAPLKQMLKKKTGGSLIIVDWITKAITLG